MRAANASALVFAIKAENMHAEHQKSGTVIEEAHLSELSRPL